MPARLNPTVYRLFDRDDVLLYVGCSLHFAERMDQHRRRQPWWHDVARITVEHHDEVVAAYRAEYDAIRDDHPLYNRLLSTAHLTAAERDAFHDAQGWCDGGHGCGRPSCIGRRAARLLAELHP